MAEKQVNLAQGYGSPAYERYEAAQKKFEDMLAERENRLFDPTLLAMAQGFLAPTKTGSFGESLGNVAGAVAPVQAAEDKRAMDMARMRLEMAQQGVQTDIGLQQQKNINADIARNTAGFVPPTTAPAAPSAAQGTQAAGASVMPAGMGAAPATSPPVGGALPSAPAASVAPAAPAAPQGALSTAAQQPAPAQQPSTGILGGIPLGIPASDGGMNMSPAEANIVKIGMAQGKSLPDMYKFVTDRRNDETVWKEGFGVHRPTNTFIPAPSAEQVEIQLPGDKAPRKVFKSDSMALQHYAQTNDPRYNQVLDRMKNGPQIARQPVVPTGNPPGTAPVAAAPPSVGIPTTTDVAAERSRAEAEASAAGTGSGKRTSAAMDKYEQAMESKNAAISVKELIAQPGAELTMGVFEKPTVKAAILGMVRNREFDDDAFREAYTKLNVKYNVPKKMGESEQDYTDRKQAILDRSREVASQAAMLQFQVSMLAKGQGQITDNERKLFAATTLGIKDSVSTMNRKADMIIERAQFAQNVANALNKDKISLDQYKLTPEYKALEKNYEDMLRNIWNPSGAKTSGAQAPTASSPDFEAARRRLEARLP
jgi:hypothetical protein